MGEQKLGYDNANLFSRVTFAFVNPLIRQGWAKKIGDDTAKPYLPATSTAERVSTTFTAVYDGLKSECKNKTSPSSLLWRTYFHIFRWRIFLNLGWSCLEMIVRIGSPLVLRQLLDWFVAADSGTDPKPEWQGWVWASLLGILSYAYTLIHHQFFFSSMRMGFEMRQQAVAAVQSKVLFRLNSVAISDVTAGKIVNLVSNDVRRFDDIAVYGPFLIFGPIELMLVFVLVGLRLGFAASAAGVSTLLLLIPAQWFLGKYISRLRLATAAQTDERVRLTGEIIPGMLAAKMLTLEDTLRQQIEDIRKREAGFIKRMSRIRALNMSVTFIITPVCSLVTFAVARSTSDQLTVPDIFYSIALLGLLKLSMAEFFVRGVEVFSELKISMRRLGGFLALPEPSEPWHYKYLEQQYNKPDSQSNGSVVVPSNSNSNTLVDSSSNDDAAISINGADFDWHDRSWTKLDTTAQLFNDPSVHSKHGSLLEGPKDEKKEDQPEGTVEKVVELQNQEDDANQVVKVQMENDDKEKENDGPRQSLDGHLLGPAQSGPILPALSLSVKRGQLVAVVGPVGAGKSSLLAALLGELQPTWHNQNSSPEDNHHQYSQPEILVKGSVAYCSQVPWITAATVQENILFGLDMDDERYQKVIEACALDEDLKAMPAGDETEIGERGISISGGQKARLALARAAYSRASIQLLDDPLSAVDAHVGRILFDKCIGPYGVMKDSTRVLITHQRQYLPACDRIIVLRQGKIAAQGTFKELSDAGIADVIPLAQDTLESVGDGALSSQEIAETALPPTLSSVSLAPSSSKASMQNDDDPEQQTDTIDENGDVAQIAAAAASLRGIDNTGATNGHDPRASRQASFPGWLSLQSSRTMNVGRLGSSLSGMFGRFGSSRPGGAASRKSFARQASGGDKLRRFISGKVRQTTGDANGVDALSRTSTIKKGQLVTEEDRAVGSVDWKVYGGYMRYMGIVPVILIALGLLGGQALLIYADYWLAQWASQSVEDQQKAYWVWIYACFVAGLVVIAVGRTQLFFARALKASSSLHSAMIERVLHAPLSFFHTNPSGRVLNRFSKDQGAMDEQLPQVMFDTLQALMMVIGCFILLIVVVPFIVPVFIPLGIAFIVIQRRYVMTSRELKRFEAVSRSPVYSLFSSTMRGLPTIRAYAAAPRFRKEFLSALTKNSAWWFCWITTARWTGFRLDFLVAVLLTLAPLLMMAVHSSLSPRLVGLALSQSLQLAGMLQWMVRQAAEVENNMTSVERIMHYSELDQEEDLSSLNKTDSSKKREGSGRRKSGDFSVENNNKVWPTDGKIEYQNVTAIYRPGLPPVLKELTFTLPGGTSTGIAGRTGSGKSSLMLTLFRLIPITGGTILLDDVDISTLPLKKLRRQIAVIPQDPVLFSGTLRSNLDPFGTASDAELWDALRTAQLTSVVRGLGGLDQKVRDCGDNLSVGSRQLLALARALLFDAPVLALDEATANVDRATDALIQKAIKEACGQRRRAIQSGTSSSASNARSGQRTLIVVAHRLDTIMETDQLLVLGGGKLLESGPPLELTEGNGIFARMVKAARAAAHNIK